MKPSTKQFLGQLAKITLIGMGVPIAGSLLSVIWFEDWYFNHEPIHAVVEAYGAFIAFGIVALISAQKTHLKLSTSKQIWIICALLAMGIFDIFHAATKVSNNFVWLHSLASFAGGTLFAGVCIPSTWYKPTKYFAISIGLLAIAISILSIAFPEFVPAMKSGSAFSISARTLNIVGGIGYIIAFTFFLTKYYRDKVVEEYLLSAHCLLFGIAGILFEFSILWDFSWWWWHALRLVAYMILLYFFYESYRVSERTRIAKESTEKMLLLAKQQAKQIADQSKKLEQIALTDKLTGISNRHDFELVLNNMINSEHEGNTFALLIIDIDNFKDINDSNGHDIGDACLQHIAKLITTSIGSKDFTCRLGGDEFAILYKIHHDASEAGFLAAKLNQRANQPINVGQQQISNSITIGIACYPQAGKTRAELLRHADLALYQAKASGKNQFAYFTDSIQHNYENRMYLLTLLDDTFDNVLTLAFQPIHLLSNNHSIVGFEVLLRTKHQLPKNITIEDLINAAESKRIIDDLTVWIIHTALQLLQPYKPLLHNYFITFNLSPQSLQREGFIEKIDHSIKQQSIESSQICFELTESALMQTEKDLEDALISINAMQYQIALDDFGKGQSSLARLASLAVSIVKLDMSFIKRLPDSQATQRITASIIELCHQLDINVVAEGIESKKQLEILQNFNCDWGQGYLLNKPLSIEQLIERIKAQA